MNRISRRKSIDTSMPWGAQLLLMLLIYWLPMDNHAARVVAEKRECATCHIAWMAEFKRTDVFTLIPHDPRPVEKTGRQDVVSTERMCFSCHDGFVLDSRFLWQEGHSHPVGMKPSDKVEIPTEDGKNIFPLNDAGNVYCGTCHSAHGIEWGDKLSPVFLRAKNVDSSLCVRCHTDRKGETEGQHNHPLMKDVPEAAKGLLKVGSKFGRENKMICQSCHKIHGAKEKKLLVANNDRSQLCSTCHADKNSDGTKKSDRHFSHPVNVIPNIATIPSQFTEEGAKFGPNREIICETCHQVHHATSDKLMTLDRETLKDGICITCHDAKRGILTNGHNMFETRKQAMADSESSTILGTCGACHKIHGGQGPRMWTKKPGAQGDRIAGLCLSCHSKGHLAEDFTVGDYSHPVGAPLPKRVSKPEQLPLFTPSGKRTSSTKYGRVSCPTCHEIHNPSPTEGVTASFGGNKKSTGKYLRIGEQDRRILCKACHQDKWSVSNTKHDIENNRDGGNTTSSSLGVCGNCHLVHNGLGPRMWARDNVSDQPATSALCLSCHKKGALAEDKTTGEHSHPIAISIENTGIRATKGGWIDRDGDDKKAVPPPLPLYDEKGSKQKGGSLVGCGTCHDPHRWDSASSSSSPLTVNRDEEGDSSNSFLRAAASPDGQLCTICHRSKSTIRATDHDMAVTAPETSNALRATPEQSGVCGQCHAVHNANQDLALWARLPGPGQDAAEMLCRSCHREGEVAQAKAPKQAHHPSYVRAWSNELRMSLDPTLENIPMFSNSGRQTDIGQISCPTCHNAHQWRARKAEPGSGKNEEGDVLSSFLRLPSTEGFICADCHGLDSIFRYKYFHGTARDMLR
ncbi:MAG: cytochrome c3 family protein [Candidatus Thiodiazotropha sp.]